MTVRRALLRSVLNLRAMTPQLQPRARISVIARARIERAGLTGRVIDSVPRMSPQRVNKDAT